MEEQQIVPSVSSDREVQALRARMEEMEQRHRDEMASYRNEMASVMALLHNLQHHQADEQQRQQNRAGMSDTIA